MTNVVKTVVNGINKIDPVQGQLSKLADRSKDNKGLAFFMPGAYQTNRISKGEGLTPKLVGDPGSYFKPSQQQEKIAADQAASAAAAAEAARPHAPNQNTAANAAQQQADYMRRRRGVLGNIFGGNQANSAPVATATKSLLGS